LLFILPGVTFGKPITVNPGEEDYCLSPKQRTFLQTIKSIPMDKPAIQDIRKLYIQAFMVYPICQ